MTFGADGTGVKTAMDAVIKRRRPVRGSIYISETPQASISGIGGRLSQLGHRWLYDMEMVQHAGASALMTAEVYEEIAAAYPDWE